MTSNSDNPAERPLPPLTLITGPRQLQRIVARIRREPSVGIDTESNSLHAYQEQVCLIQVSVPDADYIIDPLSEQFAQSGPAGFESLGDLLTEPSIQKIFHAAEYDLIGLKRDYGFEVENLFDTMQAARILGWPQVGLGTLLEKHFGVTLDKRLQRADWGQRPLSPDLLGYARLDTRYLIDLRDLMRAELERAGRLEEAEEEFARLAAVPISGRSFDPDGFWRLNGANELSPRQLAALRELYLYRDEQAARLDRPPFKVLGDETLVQLATRLPANPAELRIAGLSPRQTQRFGAGLLAALERARAAKPPGAPPQRVRPDDAVLARYDALRSWRKERARLRGVESDIILPREALWALAHNPPRTPTDLENVPGLGPWHRQEYGAEILGVLARLR
jgi:ribonuclease D